MAEGWARHLKPDVIDAYSAGIMSGRVSSRAIEVMAQAGVDISEQWSKHIDTYAGIDFDYMITLCDNARQQCPVLPGRAVGIHRPFEDPAGLVGSQQEVMAGFAKVSDQIKAFVEAMPGNLQEGAHK